MNQEERPSGPPQPERRLAAILAADAVGYGTLMQRDEEGTHRRVRAAVRDIFTPAITRRGGRVVKTTGDGLLAVFTSLIEAVRCAVEVQEAMAGDDGDAEGGRLRFRMGINLGDVLIEDNDVFGDGVNVAARLESLAEPGAILVSGAVHEHVSGRLPFLFDDLGERTGKGFERMIHVYRVAWHHPVGAAAGARARATPALPGKLSIAVLPFTNMSSDPEQEYFADGLAEDLITDLSKVPGLLVIARHSSFAFKGTVLDIRSVAHDLGVSYIIEGSVRRAADRVRINAQLIDATDNSHLWADRFDGELADVFRLQDEVVGKIIDALSGALPAASPQPRRRVPDLAAYDLLVRARPLVTRSPADNDTAQALLEEAVALDPDFAEAHAWLAMSYHMSSVDFGPKSNGGAAIAAARRAVELDPLNADGHTILGYLLAYEEFDLDGGFEELRTALRLNPNHADAWIFMADLKVLEGEPEDGIQCARNAFRLNPHPPSLYHWLLGWAEYSCRRYEDAVATLSQEMAHGTGGQRILAAALAQLGRAEEARSVAQEFLAVMPQFAAHQWEGTQPFRREADREHFIEGYVKAGLPA